MGNSLDFVALWQEISRAASSAYADGQPALSQFDNECPRLSVSPALADCKLCQMES
jgi:hypothetical protein